MSSYKEGYKRTKEEQRAYDLQQNQLTLAEKESALVKAEADTNAGTHTPGAIAEQRAVIQKQKDAIKRKKGLAKNPGVLAQTSALVGGTGGVGSSVTPTLSVLV